MAAATPGLSLRFGSRSYDNVYTGMMDVVAQMRTQWDGAAVEVGKAMREYLNKVAQDVVAHNSKSYPNDGGPGLAMRTGRGMQSVLNSVKVSGRDWETLSGRIGGAKYLTIHEYGGVINAKGKFLTIPLPAAIGSKGKAPPFARQWKNTFVARTKAGNLIIFQKRGQEVVPLYLLRTSVTIPARLGMRTAMDRNVPYFVERATDRALAKMSRMGK